MTNHTKHYYDTYWTDEGFNPTSAVVGPFPYAALFRSLPEGKVLEVGCGDGSTSGPWIVQSGREYTGVDISQPAIAGAKALGLNALLIEDATRLPFPDGAFDGVICTEVLEHLFLPHLAAAEIHRVLRPGGVLIVTVPNAVYWRRRLEAIVGVFNPWGDFEALSKPWRDPHIRFFTAGSLRAMLEQAGFRVRIGGHGGRTRGLKRLSISLFAQRLNAVCQA